MKLHLPVLHLGDSPRYMHPQDPTGDVAHSNQVQQAGRRISVNQQCYHPSLGKFGPYNHEHYLQVLPVCLLTLIQAKRVF